MAPAVRRPGRPKNDGTPGLDRAALAKAMMATTWPEWSLKTRCRYGSEDDFARFTGYSYKQLEAGMLEVIKMASSQQPAFSDLNQLKDLSVTLFKQHYAHLLDGGPKRRTSGITKPAAYEQDMHTVLKHLFAKIRFASVRGTSSVKQALALPVAAEKQKTKKLMVVLKATPSTSTSPPTMSGDDTPSSMVPPTKSRPPPTNELSPSFPPRSSFVDTSNPAFEPPIPRRASKRLHGNASATPSNTTPTSSLAMMATVCTSNQEYIRDKQSAYTLPALQGDLQPSQQSATCHENENETIITSFIRPRESVDLVVKCNANYWHLNESRASRLSEFFRRECQKQSFHPSSIKRIDMSNETPITVHAVLQFIHETDYDFFTNLNDTLHVPQELHADCHFDIAGVANKYDRTYQLSKVAEQKFIAAVEAMDSRPSIADLINKVFKERSPDSLRAAVARHCLKHVTIYTHNQAFWKVYTGYSSFAIKFLQAVSSKEESEAQSVKGGNHASELPH